MTASSRDGLDRGPWKLRDAIGHGQFELIQNGVAVAWMRYRRLAPNRYFLLHTEVVHSRRENGAGRAMVEAVLQEIRSRRGKVTAICPFVSEYLTQDDRYRDLIDVRRTEE